MEDSKSMSCRAVQCSREVYRAFIESGVAASRFFHSLTWIEFLERAFPVELETWQVLDATETTIAAVPLMKVRKGPVALYGSPLRGFFTDHAGPAFAKHLGPDDRLAVLRTAERLAVRLNSVYVEWGLSPGDAAGIPGFSELMAARGYDASQHTTSLVNLEQSADDIWNRFEGRARNMIRKAEKAGVEVSPYDGDSTLVGHYFNILNEIFQRSGTSSPHPESFFQAFAEMSLSDDRFVFLVARSEGSFVGGAMFLAADDRMTYLSGVTTLEGRKLAPNSLLIWHAMKVANSRRLRVFDLGGTGNSSIDKFKASFGGTDSMSLRFVRMPWFVRRSRNVILWAIGRGFLKVNR